MKTLNDYFNEGLSFEDYFVLSEKLVSEGKTSGAIQDESMVNYTKLGHARLKRLSKQTQLSANNLSLLKSFAGNQKWLVLSETWCGDAAQNLPLIHEMAKAVTSIQLSILLRDEHLKLMDQYLTNGGRSIPKLIAFDEDGVCFTWGPRPQKAQDLVMAYKAKPEPKESYQDFVISLQKWYNADKGESLQQEILDLLHKKSPV